VKVTARTLATEGPSGDDSRAVLVTVILYGPDADALVASFDPASATSPPAADCRAVARPIAEAVAALDRP